MQAGILVTVTEPHAVLHEEVRKSQSSVHSHSLPLFVSHSYVHIHGTTEIIQRAYCAKKKQKNHQNNHTSF